MSSERCMTVNTATRHSDTRDEGPRLRVITEVSSHSSRN